MKRDELFREIPSDRDFVWEALEPMVEYAVQFVHERYKVNPAQHRRKTIRLSSIHGEWIFYGKDCFPGDDYRRFYAGSGAFALCLEEATPVIMAHHTVPIIDSKRQTTYARLQVLSDISPFLGRDYTGPVDRGFLIRLAHFAADPRYTNEPKLLSAVSVYTEDDGYDWDPILEFQHNRFQFAKLVKDLTIRDYRQLDESMKQSGMNSWSLGKGIVGININTLLKSTEQTALGLLDAIASEHLNGDHFSIASVASVVDVEMRQSGP